MKTRGIFELTLAAAVLLSGCGKEGLPIQTGDADLGPIESVIDEVTRTIWPGNVREDRQRYVRRLNGFFNGQPTAYWFAGFASRQTADVFWFCREGDTKCPLDETGTIDRTRTVGDPVFARILGERGFSPFWLIWVVRVPESYEPDSLKSVLGIKNAAMAGEVEVSRLTWDHGGTVGPDAAIMHCLLVLDGTILEENGGDVIGQPGAKTEYLPLQTGWHKQYKLHFYDFTPSDGVFPPDPASESVLLMPSSDIFVFFRDCKVGSTAPPCQMSTSLHGAVSERGIEHDLTDDGDKADNNNIISGFPRTPAPYPDDRLYSPLWKVHKVRVKPEHDQDLRLIDITKDQDTTMVKDTVALRDLVARGMVHAPELLSEEDAGDSVPGNDGIVFFNCPSQVAAR